MWFSLFFSSAIFMQLAPLCQLIGLRPLEYAHHWGVNYGSRRICKLVWQHRFTGNSGLSASLPDWRTRRPLMLRRTYTHIYIQTQSWPTRRAWQTRERPLSSSHYARRSIMCGAQYTSISEMFTQMLRQ